MKREAKQERTSRVSRMRELTMQEMRVVLGGQGKAVGAGTPLDASRPDWEGIGDTALVRYLD